MTWLIIGFTLQFIFNILVLVLFSLNRKIWEHQVQVNSLQSKMNHDLRDMNQTALDLINAVWKEVKLKK